ncbi:hypothetical protein AB0L57_12545 [Nocardia sp. NPDC052254]|uniref:hypothetical protein n=1 Tax=Nocardia sp. NPDC052254 TaxID=3155681 RepID=UPI003448D4FA
MRRGDSPNTGIDTLLDSGKDGLNFFSTFIPRYKAWTGANPAGGDEVALTARYDQQRGMDVDPLRTIGSTITRELDGSIGDAIRIQQLRLGELPSQWNGSLAADNAAQMVQRVGGDVGKEHDNLSGVAQALSAAAEQLENVVRTKADAVRTDFATATTLAGKSADQIDKVITYAGGSFGGASDAEEQRTKVRDILPEIGAADEPATYAKNWLDRVFVPALDGKIAAFTGLTDATHTAVTGVYDQLGKALESLGASPYKGPDGQPSASTGLQPSQPGNTQALFSGLPQVTPASLTTDAPAAATAPAEADGTDPAATNPTATPVSALNGDTPPSRADPVAAAEPAAPTEPTSETPAEPTSETPAEPAAKPPTSSTDMGKVGEWRPGDISNVLTSASQITGKVPDLLTHLGDPLKAVGETAKDFGEAFKSVVGTDGITGLVKEGVDAAEKIDKLVDHHTNPGAAEQPTSAQQPGDNPATPGDGSASETPPAQDTSQAQSAPTEGAGHPDDTARNNAPQNGVPPTNDGKSIPGTTTPAPAAQPVSSPTAAATPNASSAMSPGGFLGGGHGSPARSENETEHRPKIQYVAPVRADGPDFVDAADTSHIPSRAADSGPELPEATPLPDAPDSDAEDAEDSEPEVKRA